MNKLTILRGIPGSGKSTLARKLLSEGRAEAHFEADMYFVRDGVYHWDSNKLGQAHSWCMESTFNALRNGKNVIVSNTFTRRREYQPYVDFCVANDIDYEIIVCNGEYQNVHGVPTEVVQKMRERFQYV